MLKASVGRPRKYLSELLGFLGLPLERLPDLVARTNLRSNPGKYPRFLGGWLLASRIFSGMERGRYARIVGKDRHTASAALRYGAYVAKLGIMVALAAGIVKQMPAMRPATEDSLNQFLREANSELDDILVGSWSQWWYRNE